jgi:3-hydroxyisobutyrate dehydrogenase-like beta-hydroxyacid dehydrogenase
MDIRTIGVMSPGDMGQAIAQQLKSKGFTVLTALAARSARTQALGRAAGLADVGAVQELVAQCDVILSVMNPGSALDFAREVAAGMRATCKHPVLVDCNAIAPQTMVEIGRLIADAGGRVVDGGIIGPPPRGEAKPRLYLSGPGAEELSVLSTPQLIIRTVGSKIGDASATKMCFSAMNKGMQSLVTELMVASHRLGVADAVTAEFGGKIGEVYRYAAGELPKMPSKAYRWVPEMREIAKTFAGVGLTPRIFEGAAELYEFVAQTPLGKETPENRDKSRTGEEVAKLLAAKS